MKRIVEAPGVTPARLEAQGQIIVAVDAGPVAGVGTDVDVEAPGCVELARRCRPESSCPTQPGVVDSRVSTEEIVRRTSSVVLTCLYTYKGVELARWCWRSPPGSPASGWPRRWC